MKTKRNSLSFKQAFNTVVAAFIIGIVAALVQLYIQFKEDQIAFDQTFSQVINISKQPAMQAVYNFDDETANLAIIGMFEFTPIYKVQISESFGTTLAEQTRPPTTGSLDWLAKALLDESKSHSVELVRQYNNKRQIVGKMDVWVSNYALAEQLYRQSLRIFLSTSIQTILLALVLLMLFYRNITQPLLSIVKKLTQVDIQQPGDSQLLIPKGHQDDELGMLVRSANKMINTLKQDIAKLADYAQKTKEINGALNNEVEERLLVEKALHLANESLEESVVKRTSELTQEISVRKQAEIELKKARIAADRANSAKSTFLANMSHEIRTPLNAILGFSEIMSNNKSLPEDTQAIIRTIERSGHHLLDLINDILDLSKIEAGVMTLKQQHFDLPELLQEITDIFAWHCSEKDIHWQLECSLDANSFPKDSGGRVYGDQRKIRQVLLNLAGNAVKFTDNGSTVTLALTSTGEQNYLFSVTDCGPGVPIDDQQHILQPFHQTQAGEEKGGTGLGLSICIRLLALMQSQLTINSTEGEGCTFSFELMLPFESLCESQTQQPAQQALSCIQPTKQNQLIAPFIAQNTTSINDYADITIPSQLSEQLLSAAKLYQLSQIKPLLNQLEQLGSEHLELSKHLEKLVSAYKMDAVGEIIGQLTTTE